MDRISRAAQVFAGRAEDELPTGLDVDCEASQFLFKPIYSDLFEVFVSQRHEIKCPISDTVIEWRPSGGGGW